jgi:hypothetical protein
MHLFPCKKLVIYYDSLYHPGVSLFEKECWKFSVSDYEILYTDEDSNIIRCAVINRDVNTHYARVENTPLSKYIPLNAISTNDIKTIIKERLNTLIKTANTANPVTPDQQKSYMYSFIPALIEYLDIAVDTYRSTTTQEYIEELRTNLQRKTLNIEDFKK